MNVVLLTLMSLISFTLAPAQNPASDPDLKKIGPEVYMEGEREPFEVEGEQDAFKNHDYLDRDHPQQEKPLPRGMVR